MIEGTYIEKIINRCYVGWIKNLGVVVDPCDRGRESDGTFKSDDKTTSEVNEAWVSGKSPAKKKRKITKRIRKSK